MLFVSYHMELDLSTVKLIEKWSLKFLRVMGSALYPNYKSK